MRESTLTTREHAVVAPAVAPGSALPADRALQAPRAPVFPAVPRSRTYFQPLGQPKPHGPAVSPPQPAPGEPFADMGRVAVHASAVREGVHAHGAAHPLEVEADGVADRLVPDAGGGPIAGSTGAGGDGPLSPPVRERLAPIFGFDFSAVRIHADHAAGEAARARHALAFTRGTDVYFAPGAWQPDRPEGLHLLAHELTHVVQQGRTPGRSVVQCQEDPDRPMQGGPVQTFGIAYKPEGVNLRETPAPDGEILARLPFNTRVFVDSQEGDWFLVTTDQGGLGYCATTHVKTNLPEPEATIHWIEAGETALSISRKHYGGAAEWGTDHRFYVNGLVFTNQGPGERGIFKPDPGADWDTTQVRAGVMIWIPSLPFLQALRGKLSSGSITYGAYQAVANNPVGAFLLGASAFVAGVLHGALESLWDVLVGLKDLAVMLWEVLKSLFTGELLNDAENLWRGLADMEWGALGAGWLADFDAQWNHADLLKRWHFRGWVVGYAVMEILMLVYSAGIIQGIKWIGKATKVAKVVANLPRVQKFVAVVKESKAVTTVARGLGRGAVIAENTTDAAKWIERLLLEPKLIWGKSPEQLADVFIKAGYPVVIEPGTKGSKLSKQLRVAGHKIIQNMQVHPGGGRHGGSYYKISTSTKGIIKVVDRATYVPIAGEKATIIYVDGLEGWLVRAVAANSAVQSGADAVGDEMQDP